MLRILILVIAIVGVAAIGWYLLSQDGEKEMAAVEVERTEAPAPKAEPEPTPEPEQAAAPAETTEQPAAAATEAPAAETPAPAEIPAAGELAAMTPDQFAERYYAIDEAERATFITDYVAAAGEQAGLAVAQRFFGGPVEQRDHALSFAVAQVLVAEHNSRLGSYLAGTMAMKGQGTERDLQAATRYLRHPDLLETSSALFFRAQILVDPDYPSPNAENAVNLLKKALKLAKPNEFFVPQAEALLAQLGG